MNLIEMRRKRSGLIATARAINEAAAAEERMLTSEEQNNYDAAFADIDALSQRIEQAERQERLDLLDNADSRVLAVSQETRDEAPQRPEFRSRTLAGLSGDWLQRDEWRRQAATLDADYRRNFGSYLQGVLEQRALQVDVNTSGGYLLAPLQMVDNIIQAVDNMTYIRQWGTVFGVPNADALGAPSLENDPADPAWTSELGTGDEDSTMSLGRRDLRPHPLAKRIKASNTLLRKVPSAEALVTERLAYKFGVAMENAYLNGSGAAEPLGVFTASNNGIPTGRDVSTDNTSTAITFDGLTNAKYTLKQQYWGNSKWLFHRDGLKMIAKLKDDNGQYLWRESIRVGEPDTILGLPVFSSEYVPSTFTTGLYVGILGDWSQYWIADALDMTVQRLVELYSGTNQVGMIGRMESDGMPVLSEAFVRVTLA